MARRNFIGAVGALAWFVACGGAVERGDGAGGTDGVGGADSSTAATFGTGGVTMVTGSGGAQPFTGSGGAQPFTGSGGAQPFTGSGGALPALGGQSAGGAPSKAGSGGTPFDSAGAAGEPGCSGNYLACGCGCCGGVPQAITACYYPEYGIHLRDIVEQDALVRSQTSCANAGCSLGKNYACCMTAPQEPTGTDRYAYTFLNAETLLTLNKTEASGMCATLVLSGLGTPLPTLSADVLRWTGVGSYARCTQSSPGAQAIGISGAIYGYTEGNACILNVHVTLFTATANGGVTPVRFDMDGLNLGLPRAQCPMKF